MLPRDNRLKKAHDIELVKKKGKFFDSKNFKLLVLKRKENLSSPTRFAFIISTKVSKNASLRNKSTRALREGLRRHLYHLKNDYDCVFIGKKSIITAYTADLIKEVDAILEKAKLID